MRSDGDIVGQLVSVGGAVTAGGIAYLAACRLLGVRELEQLLSLRARFRRPLSAMDQSRIRNFSIIAHIDHGKSTLADRILELTEPSPSATCARRCSTRWTSSASAGSRSRRRPCASTGRARAQPDRHAGHVDFTYEVSRSLQACEGACSS
jgi:hypothetical protein